MKMVIQSRDLLSKDSIKEHFSGERLFIEMKRGGSDCGGGDGIHNNGSGVRGLFISTKTQSWVKKENINF